MNNIVLFFEINDKVVEVEVMYSLFVIIGGIGFLLGLWRWWLSAIWLIFPTGLFTFLFVLMQSSEINSLYNDIIRELGESYIWHNYISVIIGLLLNFTGVFIGIFKNKKLKLI